jgi:peptide/nickel transport system permease protein
MVLFLGQRLLQATLILFGIAIITFLLLYCLPADPAVQIAGRSATPQIVANIRHQLGLDRSLLAQFWHYFSGLLHGDLGHSYIQKTDVATLILARMPATLVLMAAGIVVEVVLGLTPSGATGSSIAV